MTLPSLKDVIHTYGLNAKKSLGQNFILDPYILRRIVQAAGDLRDHTVIEIGPGPGGLTRAILETETPKVICIEKDQRCIQALEVLTNHYGSRLSVIEEDALKLSAQIISPVGNIKIIANLPYNIATVLLIQWLENIERISSMTLMFQKEVALRITAKVGENAYGRLSVLSQWMCSVVRVFDLPPGAFSPPPKVSSSVVHFIPYPDALDRALLIPTLSLVTQHAFGQRRKMVRSSLKPLFNEEELLSQGISPQDRAENLSVDQFIALAKLVNKEKKDV